MHRHSKPELFEIHITYNMETDEAKAVLEEFTEAQGWKYSSIQNDPVLGKRNYCYATKYANTMEDAKEYIRSFTVECPYCPVRQKIEHIVFDTKLGEPMLGVK